MFCASNAFYKFFTILVQDEGKSHFGTGEGFSLNRRRSARDSGGKHAALQTLREIGNSLQS
jgi:hypothetical protein